MTEIEKFFEWEITFKSSNDIIEKIESNAPVTEKEKVKNIAKSIISEVCKCNHPVANKLIDWGNLKGRAKNTKRLRQIIETLLTKSLPSKPDERLKMVKEIDSCIKGLNKELMEGIEQKIKSAKKGISPLHVPGSVTHDEARNLYLEESYNDQALLQSAHRVLSSICIGDDIAIYFASDELRDALNEDLRRTLGLRHVVDENLLNLKVYPRIEEDKPYLIFMKFLLWLRGRAEVSEEKKRLSRILDLLRETEGTIFFTPDRERMKYSTIPLPKLDAFFLYWLDIEERRRVLVQMRNELYRFMDDVLNSAGKVGERKKAKNELELLAVAYDIFSRELIRSSFIVHEPVRRIVDIVVELSLRYGVSANLHFLRNLT